MEHCINRIRRQGANRGECWSDLRINDAIIAQTLASRDSVAAIPTHGWEEEIMGHVCEAESRMVTGEVAFAAARLFALESRRQINCVNERLEEALTMIEEMRGSISGHEETIRSLNDRVEMWEEQARRRRRRVCQSRSSGSSGPLSSHSSGDSSYETPGEQIHRAVEVPERLEGFVGDGSEERPYTHVVVDRIEDLDNLNL